MRILVTNDDGVHAPGLAALTRALARWAGGGGAPSFDDDRSGASSGRGEMGGGGGHHVTVVAPMANHSGASAAVGTVYERETIAYHTALIPGAESVPAFALDASPALSVIVGVLGGFGPPPDLIVSGINLGVNVGRSVLHSGTVGAVLTGAQLGISGLAVSMRSNVQPECWETAADLAVSLLPELAAAPARSVLNLNVPSLPLGELRGIRRGHIGSAGIVKESSRAAGTVTGGPVGDPTSERGEIRLRLGAAVPALGEDRDHRPDDDIALLQAGYASLTPLVGVHEATGAAADALVATALALIGRLLPP